MEQFSLEKWLQNKSRKVVTRDGREVALFGSLSGNKEYPVKGMVEKNETVCTWTKTGVSYCNGKPQSDDLFFADEEEKLTEFEEAMVSFAHTMFDHLLDKAKEVDIKEWKEKLLDLARKEIEKENSEFKPKFTYDEKDYSKLGNKLIEFRNNTPLCSVSYRDSEGCEIILHYEKEITDLVKEEILKDMPKWKKAAKYKDLEKHIAILEDGKVLLSNYLEEDDYYIDLEDLKTLPKEE